MKNASNLTNLQVSRYFHLKILPVCYTGSINNNSCRKLRFLFYILGVIFTGEFRKINIIKGGTTMKNKTTRKILTAVILLVLAAGMLPVPAKAGTVQNAAESEVPRSAASRTAEPDRADNGADLPGGTLPLNPETAKNTAALPSDGARLTAVAGDTSDGMISPVGRKP